MLRGRLNGDMVGILQGLRRCGMDEAVDLLVELLLGGAALGAGGDNPRRGGLRDDGQGFAAAHYQKEEKGKQEGLLPEA